MGKIVGPRGEQIVKNDSAEDKILNAYYCGQVIALHKLIYYLFRSKRKYDLDLIFRYVESRYVYLIKEYANFYNTIVKADKELGPEADAYYHAEFEEMMKHFKDVKKNPPNIGK